MIALASIRLHVWLLERAYERRDWRSVRRHINAARHWLDRIERRVPSDLCERVGHLWVDKPPEYHVRAGGVTWVSDERCARCGAESPWPT